MFRKVAIVVLSFVAFATLTVGAASYARPVIRWSDSVLPPLDLRGFAVEAISGRVTVGVLRIAPEVDTYSVEDSWSLSLAGARMCVEVSDPETIVWGLSLPFWMPFTLFAAYPVVVFGRVLWKRTPAWRRRHGLCARCGYDLRGNTSGVCPECGGNIGEL
jgi:hypothetical protein